MNLVRNLAVSLTQAAQMWSAVGQKERPCGKMRWYVKSNSCKAKVGAFLMLKYFRIFEVGGGCIYTRKCKESHHILKEHYGSWL